MVTEQLPSSCNHTSSHSCVQRWRRGSLPHPALSVREDRSFPGAIQRAAHSPPRQGQVSQYRALSLSKGPKREVAFEAGKSQDHLPPPRETFPRALIAELLHHSSVPFVYFCCSLCAPCGYSPTPLPPRQSSWRTGSGLCINPAPGSADLTQKDSVGAR